MTSIQRRKYGNPQIPKTLVVGVSRHFSILAVLILLLSIQTKAASGAADAGIGGNSFELLRYEDSGYKYLIIAGRNISHFGNVIPPLLTSPPFAAIGFPFNQFARPDFDDSTFKNGRAAFGGSTQCPLRNTIQTDWPINSELLVRRVVEFPEGATNIRIMVAINNDIRGIFINGAQITANIRHKGCPVLDKFRFDVPQELIRSGPNTVAFDVVSRGVASFFDARVLADIPAAQLSKANALVPISNISIECPPIGNPASLGQATVKFVVTATGELGEIDISQSATDSTAQTATTATAEYSLNGEIMISSTHQPMSDDNKYSQAMLARVNTRRLHNIIGLLALSSVQAQRQVSLALNSCLRPPRPVFGCKEDCHQTGRLQRASCWGAGGAVGQIPGAGGPAGFQASLCSDDATDRELACMAGCPGEPPSPPTTCDPTTTCCEDDPLCE